MWKWNDLKRLLRKREALDTSKLAAVMWPAVYPIPTGGTSEHVPKDAHCTVIYFGDITNAKFTKANVLSAIAETQHDVFVWADVESLEWFGPEQNIPVLRVNHDFLYQYEKQIKKVLRDKGIPFDETYPVYKPHVTTTDAAALDGLLPTTLLLGPVELWWADEHMRIDYDGPTRVAP